MIIRGGENIYPREIDEVLYQHPAVAAAATIGVPDPLYGEEVAAFVVLKDGTEVTEEEFIDLLQIRTRRLQMPEDGSVRRRHSERSDRQTAEARTGEAVLRSLDRNGLLGGDQRVYR